MSALLTTAGATHLAELDAGGLSATTTNDFDALIVGQGVNTPSLTDTQAELTANLGYLVEVSSGYPVLGDTDPRNTGRAADRYTWLFVLPAGRPFVASNIAVTNLNGGTLDSAQDLMVHELVTVSARYDEQVLVWVNAKTGATPTVVAVSAPSVVNRPARAMTWTARARALRSVPSGVRVSGNRIETRPPRNHPVWTAALLDGCGGGLLSCDEVRRVELRVERWDATQSRWRPSSVSLPVHSVVTSGVVVGDPRWPGGEFNFSHQWAPTIGSKEQTWELRYTLLLADGTPRTIDVGVRYD